MNIIFFIIAVTIILVTLYDVFITVLSHQGAGPLTKFWTKNVWKFVLITRYKWNKKFFINYAGPAFIVGIISVWYLLLKFAWFLLLSNGNFALKSKQDTVIGSLDILYYIGSTFSTLGLGDYTPNGFPWTLITTLGALVISFMTSFAVSYAIPVLNAVVTRRKLINQFHLLGSDRESILKRCWTGPDSKELDAEVLDSAKAMISESYKAHVYPILGYFFFRKSGNSLNLSILNLFDALTYQRVHKDRKDNIPQSKLEFVVKAIESYISNQWDDCNKKANSFRCDHSELIKFIDGEDAKTRLKDCYDFDVFELRRKLLILAHYEGYCKPRDKNVLSLENSHSL